MRKARIGTRTQFGFYILPTIHIYYGIDWFVEYPPRPKMLSISLLIFKWVIALEFTNRSSDDYSA